MAGKPKKAEAKQTTLLLKKFSFVRSTNPGLVNARPSASVRESRAYRDRLGRAAGGDHYRLMVLMDRETQKNLKALGLPANYLDRGHTRKEIAAMRRARRQEG